MNTPEKEILVVGSGIMGLTTGLTLQEQGHKVKIWTKDDSKKRVSRVASFWEPFASVPDPQERDKQWGLDTFKKLQEQTQKGVPGLAVIPGLTMFPREMDADPDWAQYVPTYQRQTREDILQLAPELGVVVQKHVQSGYTVDYPTFDMPLYLAWLEEQFTTRGGTITHRTIEDFSEPLEDSDTLVNCTGLGARDLLGDRALYGLRGQLVKVTRPPGVNALVIDDDHPEGMVNIMPHPGHIMLGGTAERTTIETPDPATTAAILKRCADVVPALRQAKVLEEVVGLRPYREKGIRVEPEDTGIIGADEKNKVVVHNYGHGGSGGTFAWGCANEVARILENL